MNYLSLVGLVLDVTGVLMLGFDLVRVQCKLRHDAEDRLATLNDVAEAAGGIDSFLKRISGDWREHEYDEGMMIPHGGFDYQSAQRSFDEVKAGINELAVNLRV